MKPKNLVLLALVVQGALLVHCGGNGGSSSATGAGGSSSATTAQTGSSATSAASTGSSTGASTSTSTSTSTSSGGGSGPFNPNPKLVPIAAGSALDLGPFDCMAVDGEDPSACVGITDYSGMAYDSRSHQMLMFGGGHATTMIDSVMSLDLTGPLKWKNLYAPTPCSAMTAANADDTLGAWKAGPSGPYPRPISAHTYDFVATSKNLDELILLGRLFTAGSCSQASNDLSGPIAHYDLKAGTWSFSNDPKSHAFQDGIAGAEFDPISGSFVSLGTTGLRLYDPVARTVQELGTNLPSASGNTVDPSTLQYANHMVYFPPSDTFYYFLRGAPVQVYALVLNRKAPAQSTLDLVASTGPSSDHQEPGYDYDAKHKTIGGGIKGSVYYAFDPATKAWTATPIQGGTPGDVAFHAIDYDPVDDVFVFVTTDRHTWAYRPAP